MSARNLEADLRDCGEASEDLRNPLDCNLGAKVNA